MSCIVRAGLLASVASASLLSVAAIAAEASESAAADAADAADAASDVRFDSRFLFGGGERPVSLERFERGETIAPGTYVFDIYVNGKWLNRTDVRFVAASERSKVFPCFTADLVGSLGLRPDLEAQAIERIGQGGAWCRPLNELLPNAYAKTDTSVFRLDLSVAQADVRNVARGTADPRLWTYGVSAGLLNYNINASQGSFGGQSQTSLFGGSNLGINIGPWRFRQDSSVNWNRSEGSGSSTAQWQNIRTFVQRDITSLRSQLTLGDSFTDGQVFDSFAFRGAQIATDDRMLPESRQGFAPVVRGTAATNANVVIRQNGVQIYQTTVAPGPFEINDLYPTGFGGNLEVTVTEADGRISTFEVAYAPLPQLLRPGLSRVNVVAGVLRNTGIEEDIWAVQGTGQLGISNALTGYAGLTASDGYLSGAIGAAFNTPIGAVSADITHSRTELPNGDALSGQRYRVAYSSIISGWGTAINANGFFFSGSDYLGLNEAVRVRNNFDLSGAPLVGGGNTISPIFNPTGSLNLFTRDASSQFNLSIAQPLGSNGGRLDANFLVTSRRGVAGNDEQFQIAYSNRLGALSYNITANRVRLADGRSDTQGLLSLIIPLGGGRNRPQVTLSTSHDDNNGFQQRALVNGALGAQSEFNYGASVAYSDRTGTIGNIDAGYRSPVGFINGSFGAGPGFTRAAINANGSIVAHKGGVAFGQPLGDTIGIVHAPGAAGAKLPGALGARVNDDGYAILPFLVPYAINSVSLDPTGLPLETELVSTSVQVAPRAGAVVMVDFKTVQGRMVMLRATTPDGEPLPFGADVVGEGGLAVGIVGQSGRLAARIPEDSDELIAKWVDREGVEQSCRIPLQKAGYSPSVSTTGRTEISAKCSQPEPVIAEKGLKEKVAVR
jgi:outer membrane usher protein